MKYFFVFVFKDITNAQLRTSAFKILNRVSRLSYLNTKLSYKQVREQASEHMLKYPSNLQVKDSI